MSKPKWATILRWLLVAFFAVGGIGNIFASEAILADYQRWGYPGWFHYLTGVLELATAILLLTRYRLAGALLGCFVMAGTLATVLIHGDYCHPIPPLIVFAFSSLVAVILVRKLRE